MKIFIFGLLGLVALAALVTFFKSRLDYRITRRKLQVILFGLPIRSIDLLDIKSISKRKYFWSERWSNTFKPSHRLLAVKRSRGIFRTITITPQNRYVFLAELQKAMGSARRQPVEIDMDGELDDADEGSSSSASPDNESVKN